VTRRVFPTALLVLGLVACSKGTPTGPSSPSSPGQQTRGIAVSGDLHFGDVEVGESAERSFTIRNNGSTVLTVTGIQLIFASVYRATWTGGDIAPGASQSVVLRFTPLQRRSYSGVLLVDGNQTGGTNTINYSGTGVRTGPLWTMSGTGNTQFEMPLFVTRVKITGRYTRSSSNFMVRIAGRLVVNELIGTQWGRTEFEGTYQIDGGGTVEIVSSTGVAWSFEEVR
jgi:hypothetical protein